MSNTENTATEKRDVYATRIDILRIGGYPYVGRPPLCSIYDAAKPPFADNAPDVIGSVSGQNRRIRPEIVVLLCGCVTKVQLV